MKRIVTILGAITIALTSSALERKFAEGYEYVALPVNTNEAEQGLSLFKEGVVFSRKDSTYQFAMPDTVGKLAQEYTVENHLSGLHYEGQLAYDRQADVVYVSHDSLLYSLIVENGKSAQLEIDGLGAQRQQFASGSSLAYRRWRYKLPGVKGLFNPALSLNGDKLYFSAELEGGKGGRDIWMVTKKPDGNWSEPENMSAINSPYNDDYPFLSGDTVLYFSSDRPDELPGWNIYRSNMKGDPSVTLLPEGVNSKGNDYNFVGNELTVFVISDRDGNPDIYSPKRLPVIETVAVDSTPIDTVPVYTVPTEPIKTEQKWEKEPCIFLFVFNKNVFIQNYDEQIKEYARIMKENPDRQFAINGYTDVRGNVKYNVALSERRCKKVYDCLVKEGVNPAQLKRHGYGKSVLFIESAKNEEEHLQNRRVEIKVVK